MKSTTKKNNVQLNTELSSEEIIAIAKKSYEEAAAITWRQAEVGRTLTQNDKIALVDDKTLVIEAESCEKPSTLSLVHPGKTGSVWFIPA